MNGSGGARRVALGSDARTGAELEVLARWLENLGYVVTRTGSAGKASDAPDWVEATLAVCSKVARGDCERGIVLDSTGIGPCMAANKINGIRAAVCRDARTALDARERHNANVLALGSAAHGVDELCLIARTWLEARFDAPRHAARVNGITAIERGGFNN